MQFSPDASVVGFHTTSKIGLVGVDGSGANFVDIGQSVLGYHWSNSGGFIAAWRSNSPTFELKLFRVERTATSAPITLPATHHSNGLFYVLWWQP
jgi:hypothetical protein